MKVSGISMSTNILIYHIDESSNEILTSCFSDLLKYLFDYKF